MKFFEKISAKIKEIQTRPEKEKVRIIWIIAIIIFAVIAAIWLFFFAGHGKTAGGYDLNYPRLSLPPFNSDLKNIL